MDERRKQRISRLIKESFSDILIRKGQPFFHGAFITVTNVVITPDLSIARLYLSIFNTEDKDAILELIREHTSEWRFELGNQLRHSLRKIPELEFYTDDTLDEVFKMEELFKKIKDEKKDQD